MKAGRRNILEKFSYETDGSVCKDKKEYDKRLNQALTALENLEKEVEVEEIEDFLDSQATDIGGVGRGMPDDLSQTLTTKYKITKRGKYDIPNREQRSPGSSRTNEGSRG